MHVRWISLACATFLLLTPLVVDAKPIDSTLFTTYFLGSGDSELYWSVCGSTQETGGCYGSGSMGPFGRVGSLLESTPSQNAKLGTVTRYIYVVDVASGSSGNGVDLYVYKKVDTISPSSDSVTVTLYKSVSLPLTGGSGSVAMVAANAKYLFIGTNQSGIVAEIEKKNLTIKQLGGSVPPVAAITADEYGYVAITWLDSGGFGLYSPTGNPLEGGGESSFLLDTTQGITPF
jgi:hypothetical protein